MTDGERWAQTALDALRAGRFGLRAWNIFLGASWRQATENRRARPALARQSHRWSATGLCVGVTVCASAPRARIAAPRSSRWAMWWLATSAMLDWHLGMVESPAGEPRDHLSAADALTLARIALVPLLAAQGDRRQSNARAFAALVTAAAATDGLDGWLARRAGITRFGRDLDTAADALTAAAGARAAGRAGWLAPGATSLVAARTAAPIAVVAATYFRTGARPPAATFGATRQLAPALLGGIAASAFAPRAGAALTSAASIASLALQLHTGDHRSTASCDAPDGSSGHGRRQEHEP